MQEQTPFSGAIPGVLEVQAAALVSRLVPDVGVREKQLASNFSSIPTGGVHNRASLLSGLRLLGRLGLLIEQDGLLFPHSDLQHIRRLATDVCVEALAQRIFGLGSALWLAGFADSEEVHWERVPADAQHLLAAIFENPIRRETFVLATAHKVDAALLQQIGMEGECAAAEACRQYLKLRGRTDLAEQVSQLSLEDDTLGFDVSSPDCIGRRHLLEVKTTRAPGSRVSFYLSRNEARTGEMNPMWAIVVARQTVTAERETLGTDVIGWLTYDDISQALPADVTHCAGVTELDMFGKWATAKITLDENRLRPGLPLDRQ